MIKNRGSKGNMLSMVALTIGIIIAVFILGFTFNSFMYRCSQSQFDIDAMAVSMASEINAGDRVGQMNELVECSRELVFLSHKDAQKAREDDFSDLSPLCEQLLSEAREGQRLVERERKNQSAIIVTELQAIAQKHNSSQNSLFGLAWLQTNAPKIERIELGSVKGVQSNVLDLQSISELSQSDERQGVIEQASGLLKGNINARLPDDGDLAFKLSGIPACIEGNCAPPRNANPDVFLPAVCILDKGKNVPAQAEYLPSAVRIICSMNASITGHQDNQASVGLSSVGVTSGAVAGGK